MTSLLLPLFTKDTRLLTPALGVRLHEGTVYYFIGSYPIYSHLETDLMHFRYITSNILLQGLCSNSDIVRVFEVSGDSVMRWKKILKEKGEASFFGTDATLGHSHKLLPHILKRIQGSLDLGESVNSIAKKEGLAEGTIRYAIRLGRLKKKNES
jgi:hypothetical protein